MTAQDRYPSSKTNNDAQGSTAIPFELPVQETIAPAFLPQELLVPKQQLDHLAYDIINQVDRVTSYTQAIDYLQEKYQEASGPVILSFINAHGFNLCFSDPVFLDSISLSDVLLRDGKGMEILYKSAGVDEGANMCGTDVIPLVLERFKGNTIALLGTDEPYLAHAKDTLIKSGYDVTLTATGFLHVSKYLPLVLANKPKVIVLGMGMPKQEIVAAELKRNLYYQCLVINGGAIIDHYGGKVNRAPKWMRSYGLEWLYRLVGEPRRLFKRYVIGNFIFLAKVYKFTGTIKIR